MKFNKIISKKRLEKLCLKENIINIDHNNYYDLVNICCGLYYPLKNFCDLKSLNSIIKKNKLIDGSSWTIPILLNFSGKIKNFKKDFFYKIKFRKKIVGCIKYKNYFSINKKSFTKKIFSTNSIKHPGVKNFFKKKNIFITGDVFMIKEAIPIQKNFDYARSIKMKYNKTVLKKSAAFSTRNICHNGHSFIHNHVMKKIKKLFIIILITPNNKYNPNIIFKTYNIIKKNYYKNKFKVISIFIPALYCGPKETFLQATIIKNIGINSLIVGRDHAGVKNFYGKYDSQKIFSQLNNHKLKIIKTKEPMMCPNCFKINFENIFKFCNKCKFAKTVPINGFWIKKKLLIKNFTALKGYLDQRIIDFFIKRKSSYY
tara:strand:+ start:273 stop:1385 length:1113 start_codon:yes stop_codon:yes gene_type:complete